MNRETVQSSCRAVQLAELEILKKVINLCSEHNIPYYALGGTLLGAVRHQGFIPWDDDVDIGIPREQYERFLEIADKELDSPFQVSAFWMDDNYPYYFSRVVNTRVKLVDHSAVFEKQQNAWVDIFPLDGMPDTRIRRTIHKYKLLFARLRFQYSQFNTLVSVNLPGRPWHERLLIRIGHVLPMERLFSTKKALRWLDSLLTRYPYAESNYVVNMMGSCKFKEMFPKAIYQSTCDLRFEDITLTGPANYDFVLKQMYGDYLTPPPPEERNKHFTEVVEVTE